MNLSTFDPDTGARGGGGGSALDPRGSKVLDMRCDLLGTIAGLTITNDRIIGSIVMLGDYSLVGPRLQVIGSYAAVVSTETLA
jgi:hypothetical protein